jgi:hypothetical protein
MNERWDTQKYGSFKLEKFLFNKSVRLDDYLTMKFDVQITGIAGLGKNLVVCVQQQGAKQTPNKAMREQIKAIGGYEAARVAELKRWESLIDAMREMLHDRMAEKQLF